PKPDSPVSNAKYFEECCRIFLDKRSFSCHNMMIDTLSMGMSTDFETAILCGANTVRVGTAIFGKRI
ncbi:MAG: YggS family pyridoxal phosphate-dependent enzyme, partial [Clostridia bacterium]|nr:YggS family pyridoxal phosphate-dependent enzyme [Clostridia bacterium]